MARRKLQQEVRKITITIPVALLQRLAECIPQEQRSEFIAEAIEEHLALIEQRAVIEETAGAWTDEHHPGLYTEEDIERWRLELWQGGWGTTAQQLMNVKN